MKKTALALALALISCTGLAMAQSGPPGGGGRPGPQGSQDHGRQGDRGHQGDHGRGGQGRGRPQPGWGSNGWRGGQPHRWVRGDNFNHYYRGPSYVVNDYSRYRLRPPPRGYHWVRDNGGNYLLVAIASGVIADLLLH